MVEQEKGIRAITILGLILKVTLLSLSIAVILLFLTALALGGFGYIKFNQFLSNANISRNEFTNTIKTGLQAPVAADNDHKNILVLGVDTLETRGNSLPLTDTMIVVSIDLKTGAVNMLPLPRDLWHEEYITKINALYTYGLERFPDEPQRFSEETIESMTGVPIHHTIVLSMDQVAEIIDLVGGIEVNVEQGFTDNEFPRPDVDVTVERDPAKLYETITFESGKQTMSGERALKYMRSRHSENLEEGTDEARSRRQQQVITALTMAFRRKDVVFNAKRMGELYRYYLDTFAQSFSPEEGIATVKALFPVRNQVNMVSHSLPIFPDSPEGVIEHPPQSRYGGQWVYIVRDEAQFKNTVQKTLGLSTN